MTTIGAKYVAKCGQSHLQHAVAKKNIQNQNMNKRAAISDVEGARAFGSLVKQGTKKVSGKAKAPTKKAAAGKSSKPSAPKKEEAPKNEPKSAPKGKTPSAKNVREALKGGHIKPAEAAALNPRGGLTPKAKDIQSAFRSGKISYEEAKDLSPSVNPRR